MKKGTISGTSSQINEIESQIKDCFKYEYKSLNTTSERVRINKVKVVTNEHFSSGAKEKILSNPDVDRANVDFGMMRNLFYLLTISIQILAKWFSNIQRICRKISNINRTG